MQKYESVGTIIDQLQNAEITWKCAVDGCCLFACQLPSKELSALHPLYTILGSAFMMQLVYACGFPPYNKKYAKC